MFVASQVSAPALRRQYAEHLVNDSVAQILFGREVMVQGAPLAAALPQDVGDARVVVTKAAEQIQGCLNETLPRVLRARHLTNRSVMLLSLNARVKTQHWLWCHELGAFLEVIPSKVFARASGSPGRALDAPAGWSGGCRDGQLQVWGGSAGLDIPALHPKPVGSRVTAPPNVRCDLRSVRRLEQDGKHPLFLG